MKRLVSENIHVVGSQPRTALADMYVFNGGISIDLTPQEEEAASPSTKAGLLGLVNRAGKLQRVFTGRLAWQVSWCHSIRTLDRVEG